ncbi:hypothetical protein ACWGDE_22880 [Streptomyces sp. NPDC054956]
MAEQLIAALEMDWEPEEFHDTYREKVAALIKAKKAGGTVEKAELPPEATNVVDLTEVLRASVERARGGGEAGTPEASAKASSASPTKAELYEQAAAAGVTGRSRMTREELAEALARTVRPHDRMSRSGTTARRRGPDSRIARRRRSGHGRWGRFPREVAPCPSPR